MRSRPRSRPLRLRPMTQARRRRVPVALAAAALVLLALVVLAAPRLVGALRPAARPVAVAAATVTPEKVVVEPMRDPTPFIASYRSLRIHLPVDPRDITIFAFHQASGGVGALHMTSLAPYGDASRIARAAKSSRSKVRSTKTNAEEEAAEGGVPTIYDGKVIRLWRSNRVGAPDTAGDCGAKPGSAVYAPVSGKVIGVRRYKLYGKYDDYQVHIQPDGWPEVDCVLIHITNVRVHKGQRVTGGVTRIASVRRLSSKFAIQLATYTGDGGDHVHMQLNRLAVPGKLPPIKYGS